MTSVLSSRPCSWIHQIQDDSSRSRFNRVQCNGVLDANLFSTRERCQLLVTLRARSRTGSLGLSRALTGDSGPNDGEEGNQDEQPQDEPKEGGSESFRKDLERMVGADDSNFTGMDLAALIRKKYGRSYDVQLIKKEFMGRSLLAMNVMWKYREQKSFPLTEEEYILRLDDVANNLKCWGAVSHIRNSLSKLKERPRIGKAVSIFIDMDETGGRSNEWIYK